MNINNKIKISLTTALGLLTGFVAISTAIADTGSTANSATIAGNYKCQRTDASNVTTSYPLTITKNDNIYSLEWDDSNGNPALYGSGIIHPDMTNVVSASFWDVKNNDINGVEMFEIKPDGSLQSNWAIQLKKVIGSETCTKST